MTSQDGLRNDIIQVIQGFPFWNYGIDAMWIPDLADAVTKTIQARVDATRADALVEARSLADDMSDSLGNLHRLDYLNAVDHLIRKDDVESTQRSRGS